MAETSPESKELDISSWPPIYVSSTHFDFTEDLHELEDELQAAGASLTYDLNEAEIILSKVSSKKRVRLDLRSKGLFTEEVTKASQAHLSAETTSTHPSSKKRKYDEHKGTHHDAIVLDADTESESEVAASSKSAKPATARHTHAGASPGAPKTPPPSQSSHSTVSVVRIEWFNDSKRLGQVQPLDQYLTYAGKRVGRQNTVATPKAKLPARTKNDVYPSPTSGSEILKRVEEDTAASSQDASQRFGRRNFGLNTPSFKPSSWEAGRQPDGRAKYAHLLQETTTEHENGISSDLPEMPEWVKAGVKYACQRLTPRDNPNRPFIDLLKEIRTARLLTGDEIGVRAYSTSVAAIAAYTDRISVSKEITALPGCDSKIANLWVEWKNYGKIQAVEDLRKSPDLKVLKEFYDIWGVGSTTARQFYHNRGWKELDDVIEYGWKDLSRVQQIGVKFYDEFQDLIPRAEVESIGEVIRQHAVKVRDKGIQVMLVGGYRRGKDACGDVDIVVSHPDESKTANLVEDVVKSLEEEEWITHTLTLSQANTERGQKTLPFREGGGGHGFDTLDKALVVWQDPTWPTKARDLEANFEAKNPNIHRRVDIIVSPWRTVGCAVVGWTGGTTFERDLRRLAKNDKNWKFDSSGVRDRASGQFVDLESYGEKAEGRAKTMEEAERRVFDGFGLTYRAPWERCTG